MKSSYGFFKLQEEMGELNQVLGKIGAFPDTEDHPDGGPPLTDRAEDELADVMAACRYFAERNDLNLGKISDRSKEKLAKFRHWGLTDHSGKEPSRTEVGT